MNEIHDMDEEGNHNPETQNLIEQKRKEEEQEEEKLCRIGWQVLNFLVLR